MAKKTVVAQEGGGIESGDDFIISRPTFAEGTWVFATKDYTYDEDRVGHVRFGQIFQLKGYINDAGLVDHRLAMVLDPQPRDESVVEAHFPRCGECGRIFMEEPQRNRCGSKHELSADEREKKRREAAHETVKEHVYAGELPKQTIGE